MLVLIVLPVLLAVEVDLVVLVDFGAVGEVGVCLVACLLFTNGILDFGDVARREDSRE